FTAAAAGGGGTWSISGGTTSLGTGATVTLGGAASASATADAAGNYSFSNLANGSYTVTPTKSGYTFSPPSQSVTINAANLTGVNFTAAGGGGGGVTFDNSISSGFQWSTTKINTPAFLIGNGPNRAAMIMVTMSSNAATNISAS